jgi:hypothetical protein
MAIDHVASDPAQLGARLHRTAVARMAAFR